MKIIAHETESGKVISETETFMTDETVSLLQSSIPDESESKEIRNFIKNRFPSAKFYTLEIDNLDGCIGIDESIPEGAKVVIDG